jgi:hypothetical protein
VSASRVIWTVVSILVVLGIPIYGLVTGHWAEMMGGRMMVWGIVWMLMIGIEAVALVAIGLRAFTRRLRDR